MKVIHEMDKRVKKLFVPENPRPDVVYVPSQFAVPFSKNTTPYIFHTLTKMCIEGKLPDSCSGGEEFDELICWGFLVPQDKDECKSYEDLSAFLRALKSRPGHKEYVILPTLGCNARCIYCYEEGREPVTMTEDTADQTIRYIQETGRQGKVGIRWFGGEPLLFPGIIDRICEGLRENGILFESDMISNGSLISPEILQKMTDKWNLRTIQISMDGSEQDYIYRKKYWKYEDYYHTVMHHISGLSEAGIHVSVRCNVDMENIGDMERYIDDMSREITDKKNVSVYFCPLNDVRMGPDDLEAWKRILLLNPLLKQAGFRTSSNIDMEMRVFHCMADKGSVAIGPDGSLYACEHCTPESRRGDIFHGITDIKNRQNFCIPGKTREKCRHCPFLPDCTSFSACPVQDSACRQIREVFYQQTLEKMILS